jgi:hypothetical protein
MSQELGAFGLLDFTMLGPFSLGARIETYETFISLISIFFVSREARMNKTADTESMDTDVRLYLYK